MSKLACRRCGGWGTMRKEPFRNERVTCDLCHGSAVDPKQDETEGSYLLKAIHDRT